MKNVRPPSERVRSRSNSIRTYVTHSELDSRYPLEIEPIEYGSCWVDRWSRYEFMRDRTNVLANPGNPRSFGPGPCESVKITLNGIPSPLFYKQERNNGEYSQSYMWDDLPFTLDANRITASLPVIPPSILFDFSLSAWKKFHTQIRTDVPVANFTYEIKDFLKFRSAFLKAPNAGQVRNRIQRTKKLLRGKDLNPNYKRNQIVKGIDSITALPSARDAANAAHTGASIANSGFLEYSFNWAPFVDDLRKFTSMADNISKKLEFLRETRGKVVNWSYVWKDATDKLPNPIGSEFTHVYSAPFRPLATPLPLNWDMDVTFHCVGYTATMAAHCKLLQNIVGLDDAMTQWRALFAATGFNNPTKVIWNAIPFSFLVDWVSPFGKALDVLAIQPFLGQWDVFNVTHSIKETFRFRVQVKPHTWSYKVLDNPGTTFMLDVTRYTRKLGLHLNPEDVGFSSLDAGKQQLFTSLGAGLTVFRHKE